MLRASDMRVHTSNSETADIKRFVDIMESRITKELESAVEHKETSKSIGVLFDTNMLQYKKQIYEKLRDKLESEEYGYTTKFIEGTDGDCREPLDYGTPDKIIISW